MKKFNFIKMQSLGNDFVIIDQLRHKFKLSKKNIRDISSRNYGIGCDQILILEKSSKKDIDFNYKIYNRDGTESGQCGNGAKCVGKYYFEKYGKRKKNINIKTISTNLAVTYINKNSIMVDMGKARTNYNISVGKNYFLYKKRKYFFTPIYLGNPHAVFHVNKLSSFDLDGFAEAFNKKKFFNKGVNISIIERIKDNHWRARIFERGSGETNACGSAACAIMTSLQTTYLKENSKIKYKSSYIHMNGGKAQVKWSGKNEDSIYLIGNAKYIFNGTYTL